MSGGAPQPGMFHSIDDDLKFFGANREATTRARLNVLVAQYVLCIKLDIIPSPTMCTLTRGRARQEGGSFGDGCQVAAANVFVPSW